jgi:hypothetical protein
MPVGTPYIHAIIADGLFRRNGRQHDMFRIGITFLAKLIRVEPTDTCSKKKT